MIDRSGILPLLQDQMQVIQQDSISAILTDTSAQVGGPVQIEDPVLLSQTESSNCFWTCFCWRSCQIGSQNHPQDLTPIDLWELLNFCVDDLCNGNLLG